MHFRRPALLPAPALSATAAVVAAGVLGGTLGTVFAGFVAVALVGPPTVGAGSPVLRSVGVAAGVTAPWIVAFLVVAGKSGATLAVAAGWSALLLAFALAAVGVSAVGRRVGLPASLASAVAVTLALGWLAWPAWGAGTFESPGATDRLVALHPLIAANGLAPDALGVWTQRPATYRLTRLGQDAPYRLPTSPVGSTLAHGVAGVALLAVASSTIGATTRRTNSRRIAPL